MENESAKKADNQLMYKNIMKNNNHHQFYMYVMIEDSAMLITSGFKLEHRSIYCLDNC